MIYGQRLHLPMMALEILAGIEKMYRIVIPEEMLPAILACACGEYVVYSPQDVRII